LKKTRLKEYKHMCGDAKRANFLKKATPLQMALNKMRAELDEYMRDKEQVSQIIEQKDSVAFRIPQDFSPELFSMEGVYWDSVEQSIKTMTLGEWRSTVAHKLRSMFLVGGNEAGKSSLMRAMAKLFCVRTGLDEFAFLKKLDPVGLMTKSGVVSTMACWIFTDFIMKSLRDEWLDDESVKALIDPSEPGSYPARYHVAQLPKHRARMFAVNAGKNLDGSVDFGDWFAKQPHCIPLALLARGDEEELCKLPDEQQAIARRTVIFKIKDRAQIGLKTAKAKQCLEDELELEMQREKEFEENAGEQ